jgi:DNA-binding winged helix-turn-helix (wHTH) protein/Tfp pilus assembly protein PilF
MRFEFDHVAVDTTSRTVTVAGDRLPLPPRLYLTLETLVAGHGRVISREDLKAAVWADTHVESNSVSQAVKSLRRALPSVAADRIRTLPRHGYSFAGPVVVIAETQHHAGSDARHPTRPAIVPWVQAVVAALSVITALIVLWMGLADRRPVQSSESAALHGEGVALLSTRRAADLRRAAGKFARAIAIEPRSYDTLTALAQTHYLLGFYGIGSYQDAIRLARDTATRAIRIDPDRPEAYTVRASIALDTNWDLRLSAADFGRAIKRDPHDPLTRHWAAWWYLAADRMAEARETLDTAVRLDPFSAVGLTARATFAYLDGDFEAAAADSRLALTLDPDFFRAHLRLGLIDLMSGEVDRGLARIGVARGLAPESPETAAAFAHACAVAGQQDRARRALAEIAGLSGYDRAIVLTGLGRHREALDALMAARHAQQLVPGLFAREPRLAPLRRFPQFRALDTLREAPPAAPPAVLPASGRYIGMF